MDFVLVHGSDFGAPAMSSSAVPVEDSNGRSYLCQRVFIRQRCVDAFENAFAWPEMVGGSNVGVYVFLWHAHKRSVAPLRTRVGGG